MRQYKQDEYWQQLPVAAREQIAREREINDRLHDAVWEVAEIVAENPYLFDQVDGKGGLILGLFNDCLNELGVYARYQTLHLRSEVHRLAERDGWDCFYCKTPLQGKPDRPEPHVDHVIPKSRGGRNNLENKVLACPTCNCSKGARTPEEWFDAKAKNDPAK